MLKPANVATPPTAAVVAVPDSVPPRGFEPRAAVTLPANPEAVFPWASWAVTRAAGVMAAPAVVPVGCPVNTRRVAAPAAIVNEALGALPSPVAAADSV